MSTAELRNIIKDKIDQVDDQLLKQVKNLIDFETEVGAFTTSSSQKNAINVARQQIKDGNSFTDEEVNKEIGSWLNE